MVLLELADSGSSKGLGKKGKIEKIKNASVSKEARAKKKTKAETLKAKELVCAKNIKCRNFLARKNLMLKSCAYLKIMIKNVILH